MMINEQNRVEEKENKEEDFDEIYIPMYNNKGDSFTYTP